MQRALASWPFSLTRALPGSVAPEPSIGMRAKCPGNQPQQRDTVNASVSFNAREGMALRVRGDGGRTRLVDIGLGTAQGPRVDLGPTQQAQRVTLSDLTGRNRPSRSVKMMRA